VKGESVEVKMLRRAKGRAKERNLEFNLDIDDVAIPEKCPILDIDLKMHKGRSGGNPNSPALDRVDNNKGYIKGNVMVMSHLANMMKSSATTEGLIRFAEWVIKTHGNSADEVTNISEHK
jgi:hypothetical protein